MSLHSDFTVSSVRPCATMFGCTHTTCKYTDRFGRMSYDCPTMRQLYASETMTAEIALNLYNSGHFVDFFMLGMNRHIPIESLLAVVNQMPLELYALAFRRDMTPKIIRKYRHIRLPNGSPFFDEHILKRKCWHRAIYATGLFLDACMKRDFGDFKTLLDFQYCD